MNKQKIITFSKKIGKFILITLILLLVGITILYTYSVMYIPYKGKCLYEEALANPAKANDIAQKLHDNQEYRVHSEQIEEILYNSAIKGNINSMLLLGYYHSKGFHSYFEGNDHNYDKAAYWYLQAAERGNAEAQGEIGLCYKYGRGVTQSFSNAFYWIKKGADNGNAKAQYQLGCIYQFGLALYDISFKHFKDPIRNRYNYDSFVYEGGTTFVEIGGEKYEAEEIVLQNILQQPYNIYIQPNSKLAHYYWKLAAKQGLQEAKDALEKIYD